MFMPVLDRPGSSSFNIHPRVWFPVPYWKAALCTNIEPQLGNILPGSQSCSTALKRCKDASIVLRRRSRRLPNTFAFAFAFASCRDTVTGLSRDTMGEEVFYNISVVSAAEGRGSSPVCSPRLRVTASRSSRRGQRSAEIGSIDHLS